jgi:molybdopterin molybdotransferase
MVPDLLSMIPVAEAQQIVLIQSRPLPPRQQPLEPATLGLVLAEDVASDLDMPPFDKTMMDGYAVRTADVASGKATLRVIEEVLAGHVPQREVGRGQATRLMTGAPIPFGADAVVMIEHTQLVGDDQVLFDGKPPRLEQNLLRRGQEMRQGEVVLPTGTRLGPQEFGLLAMVGRTSVQVHPAPRVNIVVTGDEIVEPALKPGPGQIRNSNGPMLLAQVTRAGGLPHQVGIARDTADSLARHIEAALKADVLLLSGGVSAGKADLVPGVLHDMGVSAHFHKVRMKPGKPVFFGSRGATLVFGLPGNPVSSLACFELFVRPALRRLLGLGRPLAPNLPGVLEEDFHYKTDRPTFHPAKFEWRAGQYQVRIIPWFGSADLRALKGANCFALIAAGEHKLQTGASMEVMPVDYY